MIIRDPVLVRRRHRGILRRLPFLLALDLLFVLALYFFVFHASMIVSGSMKPAYDIGDTVIALRWEFPPGRDVRRGDVILAQTTILTDPVLKRVMAIGGDRIAVQAGVPLLNGVRIPQQAKGNWLELYQDQGTAAGYPACANLPRLTGDSCVKSIFLETPPGVQGYDVLAAKRDNLADMAEVIVPEGFLFLMGDNRDDSLDSRATTAIGGFGMVAEDDMIGRVIFRFRMPDWSFIRRPG
jgi:signal peptidase I